MAEQLLESWWNPKDHNGVEVATKWGYEYVANFDPEAVVHERKEHSLAMLNRQWPVSKSRLQALTTLQIHSATFDTGVLENEAILQKLWAIKASGIRIGLTTSGANQNEVIEFALQIKQGGEALFDLFQVTYNVFDQSLRLLQEELLDKHIVVKEALANGRVFPNAEYPAYAKAYELLGHIAKKYHVGVDAVALRFCMDSLPVFKVLSGASSERQLEENLKVLGFSLDQNDLTLLSSLQVDPTYYWRERKNMSWN